MAQKTDAWPGVSFGASFWGRPRGERRGAEVRLDKAFIWAGKRWRIPAVYVCGKGLVADFLLRVLRALSVFRPGSAGLSARIYMPQR